ncbi:uncharacterized protein BXZ73DRAFT_97799 [Epithele typhae]|uniref:uncharacterized protein n=1 Tax=Epithele typhae TaxID=378194 RepID=UPI0020084A87|nr:uncharacterized protein BXZ73DRAFT_97799 [Epithele typhae]KAH9942387.1 hypothetical protein BXZ73DRAFT_97799 [Epithele typhae]
MSKVAINSTVKATAVVIGGTGLIGIWITKSLLTDYRSVFPTVRVTTRDVNGPKARELAALGAEVFNSDALEDALKGANVVVNTLPTNFPEAEKQKLTTAIAASSAKVYFMSEFGIDYALNDFPGYEHSEWTTKRVMTKESYAAMPDKKIILLLVGVFLGTLNAPTYAAMLGLDVKNNAYKSLGPATTPFAMSAEIDIARSVAQLAVLALDPATAASVPDTVRLAPITTSHAGIAAAVARVRGVPLATVEKEDLAAYKKALSEKPTNNLFDYIKVVTGEGKLNFSANHDNELINPGQRLWKWKTLEDELDEGKA